MEAHEAGDNEMEGQAGPPTLEQVQAEFERRFAEMTLAFSNELRDRDAQIETLKAVQAPTTPIGTPDTERLRAEAFPQRERAKKKLPDPEAYNGDTGKLQGFKSLMKHKMRTDAGLWSSEQERFDYCQSRLTDRALKHMTTWEAMVTATNDTIKLTVAKWEEELTLAFGNAQIKAQSQRKWHALEQGSDTFNSYIRKSENLLMEFDDGTMADHVKIAQLERGAVYQMRVALANQLRLPSQYVEWRALAIELDDRIRSIDGQNRRGDVPAGKQTRAKSPPAGGQVFLSASTAPSQSQTTSPGGEAMDWAPTLANKETNKPRATWVTQKEIQARKDKRACLRCGQLGHMIKDCGFLPARNPARVNHIPMGEVQYTTDEKDAGGEAQLKE
jgi:hypothetical protein